MRRRPSPATGLACLALAAALVPSSPASAAPGETRATQLTRELQRDPVYVSPSLSRVASAEQVADLRRRVAEMPFPTFVAIVPRFIDEPGRGTYSELPTVLRDRIGRNGLYLIQDGSYSMQAEAFGVRTKGNITRVGSTALDAVPTRDGPVARVRFALDHLADGRQAEYSVDDERDAEERRPMTALVGGGLIGLLAPLGVSALRPSARRRRAEVKALRTRPSGPDPTLFEPSAETGTLARDALASLAAAIEAAPSPPRETLRAYEAASQVLGQSDARPIDQLGALVLATRGERALRGPVPPPCFFDPRHGDGLRASRWRRQQEDVAIPVCTICSKALAANATPFSLSDDGRPYWERDTVWAQTGFGAIDERVADTVLAGRVGR